MLFLLTSTAKYALRMRWMLDMCANRCCLAVDFSGGGFNNAVDFQC